MSGAGRYFWVTHLIGLLIAMVWSTAAVAHASLIRMQPADQSVVSVQPRGAVLEFDAPVTPLVFYLVSPDGTRARLDDITQRDASLVIGLPHTQSRGTFALSWRVASDDGHPVGGTFVYSVGAPSHAPAAIAASSATPGRTLAIWITRAALFAALFFGVGGALFQAFVGQDGDIRRFTRYVLSAGLVVAPVAILLQGLDALNAPFTSWSDGALWKTAFSTSYGMAVVLSMLAILVAITSLAAQNRAPKGLALLSLLLLGTSLASSGHASTVSPAWLARPAIWLHAVAIAYWIGSLMPLRKMLKEDRPSAQSALRRFSRVIRLVLGALVVSGVIMALLYFDRPQSLWQTAFGLVFLAKMVLFAVLLGLAAYNRYWLTAGALRGDMHSAVAMARIIAAEAIIALFILGVVAVWRFTPPPHAAVHTSQVSSATVQIRAPDAIADVVVSPPHSGDPARLRLRLSDANAAPLNPLAVTVYLSNPDANIEPLRRDAERTADGAWEVSRLSVPKVGRWVIQIDVLVSDFVALSLSGEIDLAF